MSISYICCKNKFMRTLAIILFTVLSAIPESSQNKKMKNIYDFKAKTIDGATFDFSTLKGKKILIVNTASECGYTPQYKDLEELYKIYGGDKFTIVGFPANNFGAQEPGTDVEIKEFCAKNYGVTFQMMSKISVKGNDMDPLYKWLTMKEENGVEDADVKWNFQKFLIDENGNWEGIVSHKENPMSEKIVNWIKN